MTRNMKIGVSLAVVALILFIAPIPWYVPVILIALALGIPLTAYGMLDPSQRRRVRQARNRKSLGS